MRFQSGPTEASSPRPSLRMGPTRRDNGICPTHTPYTVLLRTCNGYPTIRSASNVNPSARTGRRSLIARLMHACVTWCSRAAWPQLG